MISLDNRQNDVHLPLLPSPKYFDPEGGFQSIPNGDIVVVKKCICGMIPCHCEVKKRKGNCRIIYFN